MVQLCTSEKENDALNNRIRLKTVSSWLLNAAVDRSRPWSISSKISWGAPPPWDSFNFCKSWARVDTDTLPKSSSHCRLGQKSRRQLWREVSPWAEVRLATWLVAGDLNLKKRKVRGLNCLNLKVNHQIKEIEITTLIIIWSDEARQALSAHLKEFR